MTQKTAKSTSSKTCDDEKSSKKTAKVTGTRKVLLLKESLLQSESNTLNLERFYHPGKNELAFFITDAESQILEVLEFVEQRRSWLIDSDVCSNGRIYITTPFDATFFALHYIRKHCGKRAISLNDLCADLDVSAARIIKNYACRQQLEFIADIKCIDDSIFYKYNAERTMVWLAVKARNVSRALLQAKIHCGMSAQSANYTAPVDEEEQLDKEANALRMACGIVGSYIDADLHDELLKYFDFNDKIIDAEESNNNKRKSKNVLKSSEEKKMKLETVDNTCAAVADKVAAPIKERVLTTKEKKLSKGAKGTKSIASFFK